MDGKTKWTLRVRVMIVVFIFTLAFGAIFEALAQGEGRQQLTVIIPETLRLQVDRDDLNFERRHAVDNYLYPFEGQVRQDVKVFSNAYRNWELLLRTDVAEDLEWSMDGETWHVAVNERTVATGALTGGWRTQSVYLRLRAKGEQNNLRVHVSYELTSSPHVN